MSGSKSTLPVGRLSDAVRIGVADGVELLVGDVDNKARRRGLCSVLILIGGIAVMVTGGCLRRGAPLLQGSLSSSRRCSSARIVSSEVVLVRVVSSLVSQEVVVVWVVVFSCSHCLVGQGHVLKL